MNERSWETPPLPPSPDNIVDGVGFGIITLDPEGTITFANRMACEMLGWPQGSLEGEEFHSTLHYLRADGTAYPNAQCGLGEALAHHTAFMFDRETLWRADGAPIVCDLTVSSLPAGGAALAIVDASPRLELARAQDEFASMVSHELRTPLAALLGALKLVGAEVVDARQRETLITLATRNAERLARLVDDILDLEKARSGSMRMHRKPVISTELLASAADAVAGSALARHIDVEIDAEPFEFWADPMRIEQVLTNLVDNAIKHSPAGSVVTLSATKKPAEVLLTVRDQGEGMSQAQLDHVFDRFWQADSRTVRTRPGSGLGLTISQAIVEHHGGHISVESEVGVGSEFTVRLPVRSANLTVPLDLRDSGKDDSHDSHSAH